MMTKTLLSTFAAALLVFSVGACAQSTPVSYKPHLSVLAQELSPSQTPIDLFDLQGRWKGEATLLEDSAPDRESGPCSSKLRITWTVNGTAIKGSSLNEHDVTMTQVGAINTHGRWEVTNTSANDNKTRISGWFKDGRGIGFVRSGNDKDHCDFRLDLVRMG